MNKQEAISTREAIVAALEPVLAERGLQLQPSTIRFDTTGFTMPLKVVDVNAEIPAWHLDSVGLPAGTKPGVEFVMGGKRYRFDGVAINRPKYPISATELGNGKQYKLGRNAADYIAKEVNK